MLGDFPAQGLMWKEWRARRGLLAALVLPLLPAAGWVLREPRVDSTLWLAGAFLFGSAVLGATLFSHDEHDPARAFLYLLPLTRRRVLALKLAALGRGWLLLAGVYFMIVFGLAFIDPFRFVQNANSGPADRWLWVQAFALSASLPVALVTALIAYHVRSIIVTLVVSLIFSAILLYVLSLNVLVPTHEAMSHAQEIFALRCLLAAGMLGGWFFFLFTRTRLDELGPSARALLALLFGVGAVEFVLTIFLAGWRDLAFLVFGI